MKSCRSAAVTFAILVGLLATPPLRAQAGVPGPAPAAESAADRLDKAHIALREQLGDVASGLEHSLRTNDVAVAETLYGMERQAMHLLEESSRIAFGAVAIKDTVQDDLRSLMQRILRLEERVQDHTLEVLERVLPGEPGQRAWARSRRDLYRPLYRRDTPQPGQAQKTPAVAQAEMESSFAIKGGTVKDFHWLNAKTLRGLASGTLAEWVQHGKSSIRLTTADAKHPVIAKGRSVRGAGSMKIVKADNGEILAVVVSNSSGNFKPGIGATEGPIQKMVKLGIAEDRILVTKIIPAEPQLVQLLLKSKQKFTDAEIKARIQTVRESTRPSFGMRVPAPIPTRWPGMPSRAPLSPSRLGPK